MQIAAAFVFRWLSHQVLTQLLFHVIRRPTPILYTSYLIGFYPFGFTKTIYILHQYRLFQEVCIVDGRFCRMKKGTHHCVSFSYQLVIDLPRLFRLYHDVVGKIITLICEPSNDFKPCTFHYFR